MPASAILVAAASSGFGLMSARAPAGTGFRKTALASLIALSVRPRTNCAESATYHWPQSSTQGQQLA